LQAAFGGEAIYSSFCHSRLERACPALDAGGIQFPYLNSSPNIYPPTVTLAQPEKLALPCHSEPQAKNLFSIEILRHGLKSHSSE
jgi:hypothetical protein